MPATLAHVRKVYAERAQAMGDALRKELGDAIDFVQPQGGLFVWARLTGAGGKVADGNVLAKRAIERAWPLCPARRSSAPTRPRHLPPVVCHGRCGQDPRRRGTPGPGDLIRRVQGQAL